MTRQTTSNQRRDGAPARARDVEAICTWAALAAMVVVNALAQFGVLVRVDARDPRQSVFAWFAPDRYVQLIWVVVYALLAVWLVRVRDARHRARRLARTPFTVLGVLFIAACLVSVGWVFAWHVRNYPSAVTLVLVQTAIVWTLWFLSRRHDHTVWGWAPFSLWGSWLLVECVTDIARAVTYYVSKDGAISSTAQALSTIVVTALLLAVACLARLRFGDWVFGLVVLWSVVGIAIRLMDVSKLTAVVVIVLATFTALLMYVPWTRVTGALGSLSSPARDVPDGDGTRARGPAAIDAAPTRPLSPAVPPETDGTTESGEPDTSR